MSFANVTVLAMVSLLMSGASAFAQAKGGDAATNSTARGETRQPVIGMPQGKAKSPADDESTYKVQPGGSSEQD